MPARRRAGDAEDLARQTFESSPTNTRLQHAVGDEERVRLRAFEQAVLRHGEIRELTIGRSVHRGLLGPRNATTGEGGGSGRAVLTTPLTDGRSVRRPADTETVARARGDRF